LEGDLPAEAAALATLVGFAAAPAPLPAGRPRFAIVLAGRPRSDAGLDFGAFATAFDGEAEPPRPVCSGTPHTARLSLHFGFVQTSACGGLWTLPWQVLDAHAQPVACVDVVKRTD